jgi:predicted regulator of Ras-like GTPase activity (Roadblock/LC7/MglB family)
VFGALKKIFRKPAATPAAGKPAPAPPSSAIPSSAPIAQPKQQSKPESAPPKETKPKEAKATPAAAAPSPGAGPAKADDELALPWRTIVPLLPQELRSSVDPAALEGRNFLLPKKQVLEQLAQGSVKVPLSQLCKAGLLAARSGDDSRLIDLPLAEILKQLPTDALACRAQRKPATAPPDIGDLFSPKGEPIAQIRIISREEAAQTTLASRTTRSRQSGTTTTVAKAETPAATAVPAAPLASPSLAALASAPPAKRLPRPAAVAAAAPAPTPSVLAVPLTGIVESWPDPVRQALAQIDLKEAKCELPFAQVEQGLKQGKLQFTWKQVRAGVKPALVADAAAAQEAVTLDFPLKVVAPLFLAQHQKAPAQKKGPSLESIPDLFSKGAPVAAPAPLAPTAPAPAKGKIAAPAAPASSPAAPAPAPTSPASRRAPASAPAAAAAPKPAAPSLSAVPTAPAVPVPVPGLASSAVPASKTAKNLAELFGEPEKRNWTPNEIVHHTCRLPGVLGALIALQDGLLVASCMPPSWKTETIAAFLPQIFGRMNQYSKEFAMGELKSVTFSVEGGTLQVFNAGIIYFAALGRPDSTLPTEPLSLIAAELSRHTK